MQNGENTQVLHKNLEFIRFFSILILLIHFYCAAFPAFVSWGLSIPFVSQFLFRISVNLFFLSGLTMPKVTAILLLGISLAGEQGKKNNKLEVKPIVTTLVAGLAIYFASVFLLNPRISEKASGILYIAVTTTGYLLIMFAGARFSRLLHTIMGNDPFNTVQESFPQEERLLQNEYSVNLPAQYKLKGQVKKSWINVINPFRALLVLGTPGS
jgi:hypothetical protein